MPRLDRLNLALGLASVVLAGAGIGASLSVLNQQQQLVMASRYNSVFDISQTRNALYRLEADLAASMVPGLGVGPHDITLHNALLINHLSVLHDGEARQLLDLQVGSDRVLADLRALTAALVDGAVPSQALQYYTALKAFNAPLGRMASLAHSQSGDAVLGFQSRLSRSYWFLFGITLALIASGFSLILLLLRRNRYATRAALTDALTGLPNRRALSKFMREDLAAMGSTSRVALLLIDLDKFKVVNDTLGHGAGDDVLVTVSRRLRLHVPEARLLVRLGGDEFAIVLVDRDGDTQAAAIAAKVMAAMVEPIVIGSAHFDIGASIGIAEASARDVRAKPDDLLSYADLALYAVKASGRGQARLFTADLLDAQIKRRQLEQDLKHAIEREQFEVWFQPIVELASGALVGGEALVRWRHPERGLIPPADFIPIAEETGLIEQIGTFVLNEACRQASQWPAHMRVSVNLSVRQLQSHDLRKHVECALVTSGLSPERLELEVTETMLVQDEAKVAALLNALRRDGISIALDDFGTGHASLNYLDRFTFDKIKIDQSFVRTMVTKESSAAIVKTIRDLAEQLGATTTAEGIETEDQLRSARAAGCREGQGYLFARPMPASDFATLVRKDGSQSLLRLRNVA